MHIVIPPNPPRYLLKQLRVHVRFVQEIKHTHTSQTISVSIALFPSLSLWCASFVRDIFNSLVTCPDVVIVYLTRPSEVHELQENNSVYFAFNYSMANTTLCRVLFNIQYKFFPQMYTRILTGRTSKQVDVGKYMCCSLVNCM